MATLEKTIENGKPLRFYDIPFRASIVNTDAAIKKVL
jgi:hypothetical protein